MDLSPFKEDIDELIVDFDEGNFKSLSDMKRLWKARKFSYIFDSESASLNLALFMQAVYAQCIVHMVATYSLSRRLGGLYCLYLLYVVQPFKPPFKVYLSLDELRKLKVVVIDANKEGITIASLAVRRMWQGNAFVFGCLNINDNSEAEMKKKMKHKAMLQNMHEKLFPDRCMEEILNMDMGLELDLAGFEKISAEYAEAKAVLLKEGGKLGDIEDIKHILQDDEPSPSIGDHLGKIVEDWNLQKDAVYKQPKSKRGNLLQKKENSEQIAPVQQLADETRLEEESIPPNGFVQLLTAEEEEKEASQELGIEESERVLGIEEIERLLESEDYEEEGSTSSYANDLVKLLSEI